MADPTKVDPIVEVADTNLEPRNISLDEPLPTANDPGSAHAKGYSAEPRTGKDVRSTGPVPLAAVADDKSHVRQPEREGKVHPTGRNELGEYTPNDRLMGSDR